MPRPATEASNARRRGLRSFRGAGCEVFAWSSIRMSPLSNGGSPCTEDGRRTLQGPLRRINLSKERDGEVSQPATREFSGSAGRLRQPAVLVDEPPTFAIIAGEQ